MRRFILFLGAFLATEFLTAATIGQEQAREKAERLLGKQVVCISDKLLSRESRKNQDETALFVFNGADGVGFVIVSAEEEIGDVLGYSASTSITAEMPEALKLYLNTFQQYVQQYRRERIRTEKLVNVLNAGEVAPLLTTRWAQEAPFNNLCPMDGSKRSLTGCVATALAQIMKYWEWPMIGTGYGSATCGKEVVHGPLDHTYQWAVMLNTKEQLEASVSAATAVAELMYDCGLAVSMDYSSSASGAMTPFKALYANFSYNPMTLRSYRQDCFESETEWMHTIFHELDNGRPVYYAATSVIDKVTSHAFVIDGYDNHSFLHINWGWGGTYDGYFNISLMNPPGYQFTIDQEAIVGIEPARNGETGVATEYPYMSMAPVCKQQGSINKSLSFAITIGGVCNLNSNSHSWTPSIGLYDTSHQLLGEVKVRGSDIGTLTFGPYTGYIDTMGDIFCSLSSKTVNDGHYALRIIFKEKNGWILPDTKGGLKNNGIYIEIKGNKVIFTDGVAYMEAMQTNHIIPLNLSNSSAISRYYDLQGREVSCDTHGLVIMKQGNTVKKIFNLQK